MKTIGLIGGMSWESTVTYYQVINRVVGRELGGLHSAKILLCSVDFAEIEADQTSGNWDRSAATLTGIAQNLQRAGADLIVICTNTMHKVAPQIEAAIGIPILHIAEATARALSENHIQKVALLGTRYTMTETFYKDKITGAGIEVLIPRAADIEIVHRVIYDELCLGVVSEDSRKEYIRIIEDLASRGAQGVILGCTEIGLLVGQEHSPIPLFDTTLIHATGAALWALGR